MMKDILKHNFTRVYKACTTMYLIQRLEEQMIQFKRYLLKRITVALIKWQTRTYIYGKVKVQENLFYLILSQQT